MLLLPLLLLAAANASPVPDAAYLADCSSYATTEVCNCIAGHLQASSDGRLMLELTTAQLAAASQTAAETTAAVTEIRNRYGIAAGTALGPRLDAVMTAATGACGAKDTQ